MLTCRAISTVSFGKPPRKTVIPGRCRERQIVELLVFFHINQCLSTSKAIGRMSIDTWSYMSNCLSTSKVICRMSIDT
jgi:hypothetical protein